jgi:Tfp pilus assembly protein PilP
MKLRTGLFILVAASALAAQSTPAKSPQAKPAAAAKTTNTATTTKTTTAAKVPASAAQSALASPKAPAAAKAPAASTKQTTAAKTAASAKKTAQVTGKKAATTKHSLASKRDPFISPIQAHSNEPINCGTGKRCLVVGQTMLQGIVKGPNGMIAVVSNPMNKAYFLHENDPVYNGFVVRITPDSVVFSEQVTDKFGKKSTREVVKKVNAPAV